jgi:hypothetical protein
VEGRAGVETAGKRDADLLAGRETLKNLRQGYLTFTS